MNLENRTCLVQALRMCQQKGKTEQLDREINCFFVVDSFLVCVCQMKMERFISVCSLNRWDILSLTRILATELLN